MNIYAIDMVRYEYPEIDLEVRCGKGTYIRSLARNLGERLGTGAYVQKLRRTQVGPFRAEDGLALGCNATEAQAKLLPIGHAVADLPPLTLALADLTKLKHGQRLDWTGRPAFWSDATGIAVFDELGELNLVARFDPATRQLQADKVLRR